MRLIDADALIEAMKNTEDEYEKAMTCPSWWSAFNVISEQPTAYDVGKVVEELDETMQDLSVIEVFSHIDFDRTIQSGLDNFLKAYNSELLRIVKQGGVGTETETIRDKAVKWNNNSSKRVPYEFIDYVEGKREIGVSDDVCEWKVKSNYYVTECSHDTDVMYGLKQDFKFCPYCGKKIKVVE